MTHDERITRAKAFMRVVMEVSGKRQGCPLVYPQHYVDLIANGLHKDAMRYTEPDITKLSKHDCYHTVDAVIQFENHFNKTQ